ncbi:MAG: ATP-binding cassette domain-containing protein [candidate division KSB1 bacterium]|nr:ATP-binding cassette domain-containing protein [candidate division KSB1 bacterium]
MDVVQVQELTRRFKAITAVDGVTFSVQRGELFGLLGPNGAGKTTLIRMLTTLLQPTSGRAWVAGHEVTKARDRVRACIGIVFQEPALDRQLTGRENLDFHARMYGLKASERRARIGEVLELVELSDRADDLVEHYSGGMQRRLEIARGLINHPQVLFLDEPTLGLDAQTRRKIWEHIRTMNRNHRTTIMLTTHYMEEADALCDRVAIIDRGRIVALDRPKKLKDLIGADVVTLEVECGDCRPLKDLPWVHSYVTHDDHLTLTVDNGERRIPLLMEVAHRHGIQVRSVALRKPSLEDVFLHFTGTTISERHAQERMRPWRRRP